MLLRSSWRVTITYSINLIPVSNQFCHQQLLNPPGDSFFQTEQWKSKGLCLSLDQIVKGTKMTKVKPTLKIIVYFFTHFCTFL